jgi:hypothetical protein
MLILFLSVNQRADNLVYFLPSDESDALWQDFYCMYSLWYVSYETAQPHKISFNRPTTSQKIW